MLEIILTVAALISSAFMFYSVYLANYKNQLKKAFENLGIGIVIMGIAIIVNHLFG